MTPPEPPPSSRAGSTPSDPVEPVRGWCAREVELELPGLGLMSIAAAIKAEDSLPGRTSPALRRQLLELSNRWQGARAVHVRQERIPAAYRVFFRHIGLDPDVTMTPIEAVVLERMFDGEFRSHGMLLDILKIALIDKAIPVWAVDADTVNGPLGIRLSREQECLGLTGDGPRLGGGTLVVADAERALGMLFGPPAREHEPSADTRRVLVFAIQVAGVPALHVEETLWMCRSALEHSGQES